MSHPLLGPAYAAASAPPAELTSLQRSTRDAILAADRPEDYEDVTCLCAAAASDLVLSEVERHGLRCRSLICTACGLIRQSPRWRSGRVQRFYEREYRKLYRPTTGDAEGYIRGIAGSASVKERASWIVAVQARYGSGVPTVVELGAGGGWNLAGLPAGWRSVGYDVDDEYLRLGKRLLGIDLRRGMVGEALPDLRRADIALLSHVVEHLPFPEAELARIAQRLQPHALLLVEVPGIFRIHRTNLDVRSYLQNAHTFTFCAATLRAACERAGLEVLEVDETARAVCRSGGTASPFASPPALWQRSVRYLRFCDRGWRVHRRLARLPVAGRALTLIWRRTYCAAGAVIAGTAATSPRGRR